MIQLPQFKLLPSHGSPRRIVQEQIIRFPYEEGLLSRRQGKPSHGKTGRDRCRYSRQAMAQTFSEYWYLKNDTHRCCAACCFVFHRPPYARLRTLIAKVLSQHGASDIVSKSRWVGRVKFEPNEQPKDDRVRGIYGRGVLNRKVLPESHHASALGCILRI